MVAGVAKKRYSYRAAAVRSCLRMAAVRGRSQLSISVSCQALSASTARAGERDDRKRAACFWSVVETIGRPCSTASASNVPMSG